MPETFIQVHQSSYSFRDRLVGPVRITCMQSEHLLASSGILQRGSAVPLLRGSPCSLAIGAAPDPSGPHLSLAVRGLHHPCFEALSLPIWAPSAYILARPNPLP